MQSLITAHQFVLVLIASQFSIDSWFHSLDYRSYLRSQSLQVPLINQSVSRFFGSSFCFFLSLQMCSILVIYFLRKVLFWLGCVSGMWSWLCLGTVGVEGDRYHRATWLAVQLRDAMDRTIECRCTMYPACSGCTKNTSSKVVHIIYCIRDLQSRPR